MRISLSILILVWLSGLPLQAETVTSDGSRADTQAKINARALGDTVIVPDGIFDWAPGITITQHITLRSQNGWAFTELTNSTTTGQYTIDVDLPAGTGAYGSPTRTTWIKGFTFSAGASGLQLLHFDANDSDDRRIRVSHNKWDRCNRWAAAFESTYGVFDHNIVLGISTGVPVWLAYVKGNYIGGTTTRLFGDGAWAAADQFGTEKFLFFEDNYLTNLYTTSELTMIDAVAGARWVARNNVGQGGQFESHGLEDTRERSVRAYEIYDNVMNGFNVRNSPVYIRGGVGIVADNTFNGWAVGSTLNLLNFRSLGPNAAPFGGNSGNGIWDTNHASNPFVTCTATSAGSLTVTDNTKTWTLNQWASYTIRRTSGIAINSGEITRSGSTVTVNTAAAHGFANDDKVSIWGANEYEWQNNIWGPITVTDSDTFTFSDVNSAVRTATGSGIRCAEGAQFAYIDSNTTGGGITYTAEPHGTSYNMVLAPGDTYEINLVLHAMDQVGSGQSADLGGTFIPSLPVGGLAQVISPCYEWNNLRDGNDVDWSVARTGGSYGIITNTVHFFQDTQKPGFTKYTYPHPLIALTDAWDDEPPADLPAAPGVQKIGGISLRAALGPMFAVLLWRVARRRR